MLKALRRIVQEISSTEDIKTTLHNVVTHIKKAINADAASIYLFDEKKSEYLLAATDGLNPKSVTKFHIKANKGLIGVVGQKEDVLNLNDAFSHPDFLLAPTLKEEKLQAFLGIPMLYQRKLVGVLSIRREAKTAFEETEVAFSVTLAMQLSSAIAHAKVTGALSAFYEEKPLDKQLKGKIFSGIASVPGVAIGQALVVYPPADINAVPDREAEDIDKELALFSEALKNVKRNIEKLGESIAKTLSSSEQILFEAYLQILKSRSITTEIRNKIREGNWAQGAIKKVIKAHINKFESMEDPYLAERAADIKDLGQRLLSELQTGSKSEQVYPAQTILVAEEMTPSALAEIPESQLAGIISVKGSNNSHVAILARSMGKPTIMGASGLPLSQIEKQTVIIDGYYGQIYPSPLKSVLKEFKSLKKQEQEMDADLQSLRNLPAETQDGVKISLFGNMGIASDISSLLRVSTEGIGLYRSEFPFMIKERFPSEQEQFESYRLILTTFSPKPVVMRTLDIGGDKVLSYFPVKEENPFLGWRGIRITLDHPEIFLIQLRAMLKASEGLDNLHIMLPMVTSISEVDATKQLISQIQKELLEEGLNIKMPKFGIMLEVPAAIYQINEMVKRLDFISVGSNDLTQYLLAVDRNNANVSSLYDALHPAVLRALYQIVKNVKKARKNFKITLCGELANEPLAAPLLLAMGFDALSMNANSILRIKWVIRSFSLEQAKQLLTSVLAMDDPVKIRCHMELALEDAGLAGLTRAGK